MAVIALGVGWLAFEMSSGSVRLGVFTPVITKVISAGMGGYSLGVADANIVWDPEAREVDLTLNGLVVSAEDGEEVLSLPLAKLGLDLGEVVAGRAAPTYLIVPDLSIRVIRYEDGRFQTGLADTDESTDNEDPLLGLTGPLGGKGIAGWLRRIDLEHASIVFEDRKGGTVWRTQEAMLSLVRGAGGSLTLNAKTLIDAGNGHNWPLDIAATRPNRNAKINSVLSFNNLSLAALAARLPELAALAPVDAPLSGVFTVTLSATGVPETARADVSLGAGQIVWPEKYDTPVRIDSGRAVVTYGLAARRLDVNSLLIRRGDLRLGFRGALQQTGDDFALSGNGGFDKLSVADLKALWPKGASEGARQWVVENMLDGQISGARLALDIPADVLAGRAHMAPEALKLTFDLDGGAARYIRTMPELTGATARATLTGNSFTINISQAMVGPLQLAEANFTVPDFVETPTRGVVDLVLRGGVADVMRLIDHEPLGFPSRLGLPPEQFTGRSASRLKLTLPLSNDVQMEDVELKVASNVVGVDIPPIVKGFDLKDANMTLHVTGEALSAQGDIAVNGVRVSAGWVERFTTPEGFTGPGSVFFGRLDSTLEDRSKILQSIGFDHAPYLQGTAPIEALIALKGGQLAHIDVDMNVAQANVFIPQLAHEFKPGELSGLQARLVFPDAGGLDISKIAIAGPQASGTGAVKLDQHYQVAYADLQNVTLPGVVRGGNIAITRDEDGTKVTLVADDVAVPGLGGDEEDTPDTQTRAQSDAPPGGMLRLPNSISVTANGGSFFGGVPVQNLKASTYIDANENVQHLDLQAVHAKSGKPLMARMVGADETLAAQREVRILSEEAGPFVELIGLAEEAEGGTLVANVFLNSLREPATGEVQIREVRLKKAPTLVGVLNIGSLTGIADTLSQRGILFNEVTAPFEWLDGRITLRGAKAIGPSIGVHSSGLIDLNTKQLDMSGTMTPAYSINSAIGKIPGIGELIVGGEGQGLFAARFGVKGSFDKPQITVNPLSALTPGFLRNLFGPAEGDVPPPPAKPEEEPNQQEPKAEEKL